jgi:hypothetical protein
LSRSAYGNRSKDFLNSKFEKGGGGEAVNEADAKWCLLGDGDISQFQAAPENSADHLVSDSMDVGESSSGAQHENILTDTVDVEDVDEVEEDTIAATDLHGSTAEGVEMAADAVDGSDSPVREPRTGDGRAGRKRRRVAHDGQLKTY